MDQHGQAPGFYGKLPSYGDFVGRRLPPSVRHCLDEWLQRALVQSRIDLGPAWPGTWGSSPIWRFVLGEGVCGNEAWAGVMMPSADRVGRCFPLLLAAPVGVTPFLRDYLSQQGEWFAALEDFALSALDKAYSVEELDASLLALGRVRSTCPRSAGMPYLESPQCPAIVAALSASSLPRVTCDLLNGHSAWWTDGSTAVTPCLAICNGLPAPALFTALLDGCWVRRGWKAVDG